MITKVIGRLLSLLTAVGLVGATLPSAHAATTTTVVKVPADNPSVSGNDGRPPGSPVPPPPPTPPAQPKQ